MPLEPGSQENHSISLLCRHAGGCKKVPKGPGTTQIIQDSVSMLKSSGLFSTSQKCAPRRDSFACGIRTSFFGKHTGHSFIALP